MTGWDGRHQGLEAVQKSDRGAAAQNLSRAGGPAKHCGTVSGWHPNFPLPMAPCCSQTVEACLTHPPPQALALAGPSARDCLPPVLTAGPCVASGLSSSAPSSESSPDHLSKAGRRPPLLTLRQGALSGLSRHSTKMPVSLCVVCFYCVSISILGCELPTRSLASPRGLP